jgi:hypothetical protein
MGSVVVSVAGTVLLTVAAGSSVQADEAWMTGYERWWAAETDPARNLVVDDPLGQRDQVLQVWGEHGWWGTFRKPIVPAARQIVVEAMVMSSGGDTGPGITLRDHFIGCCNADDIGNYGFDYRADPPTIGGRPVERNKWYKLKYAVDMDTGTWRGYLDGTPIASGVVDKSKKINWVCLDAGQPGYFDDVKVSVDGVAIRDWPMQDKDYRGSRSAPGASVSVDLDSYASRWQVASAYSVLTGNVSGDDKLELITWSQTAIKVSAADGTEMVSIPMEHPTPGCLADIDGDGIKEILTGKRESDNSLSIYVFKGDGTQVKKIAVPHGAYDCGIEPRFVADVDGDGQLEIVSYVGTGYSIERRGMEVTDYNTGTSKWGTDIGPFAWGTRLADLTGDGLLELLHGSGGPANGRFGLDGTTDFTGYAFSYSAATGASSWLREFDCCGFFDALVFLPDLNGDGRPDVVAQPFQHGWDMADYGTGSLHVLDPLTGTTSAVVDFAHRADGGVFADIDGDSKEDMIVSYHTSATAHVKSFGGLGLTPKGSFSRDGGWIYCKAASDLDGDGNPEILAMFSNGSGEGNDVLLILDSNLAQVARDIDLGTSDIRDLIVSDLDGDGAMEVIAITGIGAVVLSPELDQDGDGVLDGDDACPETQSGAVVDADGCSLDQLVPCAGPVTGGTWKNHGAYVSAFAKAAEVFLAEGLITLEQKDILVSAAAESTCGVK